MAAKRRWQACPAPAQVLAAGRPLIDGLSARFLRDNGIYV
jgi:hypothetical protein